MKYLIAFLMIVASLCVSAQGDNAMKRLKATVQFADKLYASNEKENIYRAFLLYDFFEDIRVKLEPSFQQLHTMPNRSDRKNTCARRIRTEIGYKESERFVVEILMNNGRGYGQRGQTTIRRNLLANTNPGVGSPPSTNPGSGTNFRTSEHTLLMYALLAPEKREQFKTLIETDLKAELERFEQQEYFNNYPELIENQSLEVNYGLITPGNLPAEIQGVDEEMQQFLLEAPTLQVRPSGQIQLQDQTEIQIRDFLQSNPDIQRGLERRLQRSLEMFEENRLETGGGF